MSDEPYDPATVPLTPTMDLLGFLENIRNMLGGHNTSLSGPTSSVYRGFQDFVIREGNAYRPRPLPSRYTMGEPKMCFYNTIEAVLRDPALRYCEGFATTGYLPVSHAWAIDPDGGVVDRTWPWGTQHYDPDEGAMMGVIIPAHVVNYMMVATAEAGSMIDAWTLNWPLMRVPFQPTSSLLKRIRPIITAHLGARQRRAHAVTS